MAAVKTNVEAVWTKSKSLVFLLIRFPLWAHSTIGVGFPEKFNLTDTGENVQKWTRVFSTRCWVILVARTRRKKREENSVSTFGRFRLWTFFESSPVSVKGMNHTVCHKKFSSYNFKNLFKIHLELRKLIRLDHLQWLCIFDLLLKFSLSARHRVEYLLTLHLLN